MIEVSLEERATLHWEHGRPVPRVPRAILRLVCALLFRDRLPPTPPRTSMGSFLLLQPAEPMVLCT